MKFLKPALKAEIKKVKKSAAAHLVYILPIVFSFFYGLLVLKLFSRNSNHEIIFRFENPEIMIMFCMSGILGILLPIGIPILLNQISKGDNKDKFLNNLNLDESKLTSILAAKSIIGIVLTFFMILSSIILYLLYIYLYAYNSASIPNLTLSSISLVFLLPIFLALLFSPAICIHTFLSFRYKFRVLNILIFALTIWTISFFVYDIGNNWLSYFPHSLPMKFTMSIANYDFNWFEINIYLSLLFSVIYTGVIFLASKTKLVWKGFGN